MTTGRMRTCSQCIDCNHARASPSRTHKDLQPLRPRRTPSFNRNRQLYPPPFNTFRTTLNSCRSEGMIQQPLRSAYGPQTHPQGEARKQQQMHSEFQLPFFATQSHSDILRIQDDVSVSRSPGYALRVGYSLQVKSMG
ncbi:hypothetical protein CC2G_014716 [Coprinopsis cinerea AmutBmut pab1-1]|nr:hypothetical protein CC2G_014716 [Coprinopsis cinerea AmutBmut pab1-1]